MGACDQPLRSATATFEQQEALAVELAPIPERGEFFAGLLTFIFLPAL
jgi:hypothetical protein